MQIILLARRKDDIDSMVLIDADADIELKLAVIFRA